MLEFFYLILHYLYIKYNYYTLCKVLNFEILFYGFEFYVKFRKS